MQAEVLTKTSDAKVSVRQTTFRRLLFDSPVLVERGQRVTMIAEQDGVEARTIGIAIKKGRKGEMIKIKNENSEREVNAIVIGMGMVRTTQAASREKTGG
ncbi:flagellar basal body P-ring formation chaperone FlgA [Pantoea allii]|uniref:Flagella basal body P-ring formation protein FlgA n=1 Tax=Pantoea allii TaxID=574096 RepID=A0ABS6V9S9_9GAMM|nr:flagellar basal body P-ring formation chaperone FlgA [Pantoea allii]MBW1212305.1 flagellar basal body P-ring formation chaperone FlgA [Pantoea allii]MBW1256057.1 flagellar basal body P-ring formation chaperone FlgA [Pantoea allii]MBW1265134.1 flagellar basal body P-ring formation chaperone FlgA [Pantoea allii]MBW1287251.1 flagellar basal body P-ring formation chaperone FlgA [Pantoea allii]